MLIDEGTMASEGNLWLQRCCQEDVVRTSIFHRSAHPLHELQRGRSIKRRDGTLPSTLCRAMIDHRKHGLVVLLAVNGPVLSQPISQLLQINAAIGIRIFLNKLQYTGIFIGKHRQRPPLTTLRGHSSRLRNRPFSRLFDDFRRRAPSAPAYVRPKHFSSSVNFGFFHTASAAIYARPVATATIERPRSLVIERAASVFPIRLVDALAPRQVCHHR